MKRREFLVLAGATAALPIATRAQQAMPVIGFLNQETEEAIAHPVTGFQKGLSETGFVVNQNVAIEYRWAAARYERLPQLASDLVDRNVAVIVAAYFPSAIAAKKATSTIPIVFISGVDPVAAGFAATLSRPGGNLTGLSNFNTRLMPKRLELLQQLVPQSNTVAVLVNTNSPATQTIESELRPAARALGVRVELVGAGTEDEIDKAFAAAGQRKAGSILVSGDSFFNSRRMQIVALAA